jgi:hypothetical protein
LPGAIGYLRNPTSHREVLYDDDPTEAAEVVMLADLLLRMLDRIEGTARRSADQSIRRMPGGRVCAATQSKTCPDPDALGPNGTLEQGFYMTLRLVPARTVLLRMTRWGSEVRVLYGPPPFE